MTNILSANHLATKLAPIISFLATNFQGIEGRKEKNKKKKGNRYHYGNDNGSTILLIQTDFSANVVNAVDAKFSNYFHF